MAQPPPNMERVSSCPEEVVGAIRPRGDGDSDYRSSAALASTDGPVLAYCRSGTRSTLLWALAEASRQDTLPDLLTRALHEIPPGTMTVVVRIDSADPACFEASLHRRHV